LIRALTVHGFRSSFRDWAGNVSNFPRAMSSLCGVPGDFPHFGDVPVDVEIGGQALLTLSL
jgi:hypothetical protein